MSVLSDTIRVQFQITFFFCQNLPFIVLSAFRGYCNQSKNKKNGNSFTQVVAQTRPKGGVTTARELCVGTNKQNESKNKPGKSKLGIVHDKSLFFFFQYINKEIHTRHLTLSNNDSRL